MQELKNEDVKGFRNFLRMDYMIYQEILKRNTKIQALLIAKSVRVGVVQVEPGGTRVLPW